LDKPTIKEIREFKEQTEEERQKIGARLLSPLDEVYEMDFGPVIGTLRFRRMRLEDRRKLTESGDDEATITRMAEILEKYSADGVKKQIWLAMAHGDRQPEFNSIAKNLIALSAGGPDGMMEFFRALERRLEVGGSLPIPTPDAKGDNANGN
jgi:hypothetical protein